MCMVLNAGWEEGGLLVYDHRSCILPGASSSHVPDYTIVLCLHENVQEKHLDLRIE